MKVFFCLGWKDDTKILYAEDSVVNDILPPIKKVFIVTSHLGHYFECCGLRLEYWSA